MRTVAVLVKAAAVSAAAEAGAHMGSIINDALLALPTQGELSNRGITQLLDDAILRVLTIPLFSRLIADDNNGLMTELMILLDTDRSVAASHFIAHNLPEIRSALTESKSEPEFQARLETELAKYVTGRRDICLYDYLPAAIRNDPALYHAMFTVVDDYPVLAGDSHGYFLDLPNQPFETCETEEIEEKVFFGLKSATGSQRIVDLPGRCAVDVNEGFSSVTIFPRYRAVFAFETARSLALVYRTDAQLPLEFPEINGYQLRQCNDCFKDEVLLGVLPVGFVATDMRSILQSMRGYRVPMNGDSPAIQLSTEEATQLLVDGGVATITGCTQPVEHESGTAIFSLERHRTITGFASALSKLSTQEVLEKQVLADLRTLTEQDDCDFVAFWGGMKKLGVHSMDLGYFNMQEFPRIFAELFFKISSSQAHTASAD
jgi:hypothetical protein